MSKNVGHIRDAGEMILRLTVCFALAAASAVAIWWFVEDRAAFVSYFENNLRGNLFAGFLTVGGFLLSLKTFILIKLKESVYDHTEYRATFEQMKELDSSLEIYAPLQKLSGFLFYSVLSSILAAIAQLTLGLVGSFWTSLIALFLSVFAIVVLLVSLFLIKSSLNDYFDFINKES